MTYICVTLTEFQAHRDAFIQNKLSYVSRIIQLTVRYDT